MRHAAHRDSNTYSRSYQSKVSAVDGQASFLGMSSQREHQELFRGYSFRRDPNYQPRLPVERTRQLQRALDLRVLPRALHEDGTTTAKSGRERQKVYDELRRLRRDAKKEYTNRRAAQEPDPSEEPHESSFQQTRKLMPQRNDLASLLFCKGSLRGQTGSIIMHHLVTLCRQPRSYIVCPNLANAEQSCPHCGKSPKKYGMKPELTSEIIADHESTDRINPSGICTYTRVVKHTFAIWANSHDFAGFALTGR
jgi:carbonic anhydrase